MENLKDFYGFIKNNLNEYRKDLFNCDEDSQNIIYYSMLEDNIINNIKNELNDTTLFKALKLYADPAFPHVFKIDLTIPRFYLLSCYVNALIDEGKYSKDCVYEKVKNEYEKKGLDFIYDIFYWWKEWN